MKEKKMKTMKVVMYFYLPKTKKDIEYYAREGLVGRVDIKDENNKSISQKSFAGNIHDMTKKIRLEWKKRFKKVVKQIKE